MQEVNPELLAPTVEERKPQVAGKIKPPVLPVEISSPQDFEKEGRRQNQFLRRIKMCPVFEPTLQEFTQMGFQEYLVECEKLIDPNCGVYKVGTLCRVTHLLTHTSPRAIAPAAASLLNTFCICVQVRAPDGWVARKESYENF